MLTTDGGSSGWCTRCGMAYAYPDLPGTRTGTPMPQCECAGDPPVDWTTPDWKAWWQRTRDLRYAQT